MKTIAQLFSLTGRTALITGGASGIGRIITSAFLMAGARTSIVGRSAAKTTLASEELGKFGPCSAIIADINDTADIERIRLDVAATFGGLDILVNCAGTTAQASLGVFPAEYWDEVLATNLKAPFMLSQALLPELRRAATDGKPAHIINIGSVAGLSTATATSFSYFSSKAGLHHLTRVLARSLLKDNIHVNAIAPGFFPSEMLAGVGQAGMESLRQRVPMGRFGSEEDMAAMAIFIASSGYFSGEILVLDGGVVLAG